MHSEAYRVDPAVRTAIREAVAGGRRVVCIGTTSVRVVETIADPAAPDEGRASLLIAPGYAVQVWDALTEVTGLVEKPPVAEAPSNKIISGRYILQPEVMRVLENQEKGAGGEIQLTDAMARMIGIQPSPNSTTRTGSPNLSPRSPPSACRANSA